MYDEVQGNDVCQNPCNVLHYNRRGETVAELQPSQGRFPRWPSSHSFVATQRKPIIREDARVLQQRINIITPEYENWQRSDISRFPIQQRILLNNVKHDIVHLTGNDDS